MSGMMSLAIAGSSSARFLTYLHLEEKLAYNKILVRKFAIWTFCGSST